MRQQFTDLFIRRPVFASVIGLVILLVGIAAFFNLNFRQYPRVDATVISVRTAYPGASAAIMESYISSPLESALAGVNNIDYMTSYNEQGLSVITIHFKLGTNIDTAASDVSDKVSSVSYKLPKQANTPIIGKDDPNANPILYVSYTSSKMSPADITDYLIRYVQPELGTLNGVAEAKIFGRQEYAMRIWLDPKRMASRKITATDVKNALLANNLQSPTGRLTAKEQEFDVVAKTDLHTAKQFNQLVVKRSGDSLIRIRDIGEAQLGATTERVTVAVKGIKGRMMGIVPRADANPLDVAEAVKAKLKTLEKQLPPGLKAMVVYDTTRFIHASINEVRHTFIEAAVLVILVIFLFLGSLRALWIPFVTIPLSLIGVCICMLAMGFSLNTLTLLAMVLAIGMVVDDAIVVLENIHRHMENGKPPLAAAIIGAREIQFAVIAMTLTLAAVYAPIGFASGLTGSLFREFAFTLASAVIISGVVALTISPMMCSRLLTTASLQGQFAHRVNTGFHLIAEFYQRCLKYVLQWRSVVVTCFLCLMGACGYLFMFTPGELAPMEDTGAILALVNGPATANLDYTSRYTQQLHDIVSQVPEMERDVIVNGVPRGSDSAIGFLILKPWEQRKRNIGEVLQQSIMPKLPSITGVTAMAFPFFKLPGGSGNYPIDIVLKTSGDYEEIAKVMAQLQEKLKKYPFIFNVDSSLKYDKPEIDVHINRNKAGVLGIAMTDIGDSLNIALGEPQFSQFELNGRGYYVLPQVLSEYRNEAQDLLNINLRTQGGKMVPLSNIVSLEQSIVPRSLNHFQQLRSANLTGLIPPGMPVGIAVGAVQKAIAELPQTNVQFDYSGQTRQFVNESGQMQKLLLFAIIFIYLVLAAQFESFRDPFVVMLSVPLSITAALAGLKFTGGSLNIYTWIGLVTLVGLISKHGILLVEFANQLQAQGRDVRSAIIEAATIRLRPILMTTAAMVFGALPLVMASGAGAASRMQIGIVIACGMAFGTLLTLFVVPTMYTLIASRKTNFTTGDKSLDQELGFATS